MIGCALLLIVLALKPPKGVKIGVVVFAVVCAALGVDGAISSYVGQQKAAAMLNCMKAKGQQACQQSIYGTTKMGFVGNEKYADQ